MGELKQNRFDARKPSIGNRSRRDIALMFAHLSFSLSFCDPLADHLGSSSPNADEDAIYKRQRRRFHERVPRTDSRANLFGLSSVCSLVSISPRKVARDTRGWTRRISQRKHRALLSSDPFARARARAERLSP